MGPRPRGDGLSTAERCGPEELGTSQGRQANGSHVLHVYTCNQELGPVPSYGVDEACKGRLLRRYEYAGERSGRFQGFSNKDGSLKTECGIHSADA